MCLVGGDIPSKTRKRYDGLAHMALSNVLLAIVSFLWLHIADGRVFAGYGVSRCVSVNGNKKLIMSLPTGATGWESVGIFLSSW